MRVTVLTASFAAFLFLAGTALVPMPAVAQVHESVATATPMSTTKTAPHRKRHRPSRDAGGGGQIACTVVGCHRIPPNCHPTTDYDWRGLPTGYDRIVCR